MGPDAITLSALSQTISEKLRGAVDRIAERFSGSAGASAGTKASPAPAGSTEKNIAEAVEYESTAEAVRRASSRSEQFGSASASFIRQITLVGVGIAGVTAAFGVAAYAVASYRSQQKELQLSVSGAGRGSQVSVGDINRIAFERGASSGLSTSALRDFGGEAAASGRIGGEIIGALSDRIRDYAATTRQELPEASDLSYEFIYRF